MLYSSALAFFALSAASVQAFAVPAIAVRAAANNITITATGAAPVPAKPDGCATITPAGSTAQTVCAKKITAAGFTMTVKDVATKNVTKCAIEGASGTCGTTGAGATVVVSPATAAAGAGAAASTGAAKAKGADKAKAADKAKGADKAKAASNSTITITGTGAASVPAKPDGCATITPAGSTAQTVCAKKITATGFSMTVKDVATGTKTACTVTGTSGTCGTTGAGATVSALAATKRDVEAESEGANATDDLEVDDE